MKAQRSLHIRSEATIINVGEATANEVFIAGIISQIDTKDPPGNTFGNATY